MENNTRIHVLRRLFAVLLAFSFLFAGLPIRPEVAEGKSKLKKPKVLVKTGEISLVDPVMKKYKKSPSGYAFSARIKNRSKRYAVDKAVLTYSISYKVKKTTTTSVPVSSSAASVSSSAVDAEKAGTSVSSSAVDAEKVSESVSSTSVTVVKTVRKEVTLTTGRIAPEKTSRRVNCIGDGSGKVKAMKLIKVEVCAGEAAHIYDREHRTHTRAWVGEDTEAPVFTGLLKKESLCNTLPVLTVYSDKRKGYDYCQLFHVTDNRDVEPKVKVDRSRIDFTKTGRYKVYFTAMDSAGNTSKSWSYVQVIVPGGLESYEDQILSGILRESDPESKKIRAIHEYLIKNIDYISDGDHGNWYDVANNGLLFGTGDCYTYYAAAHALLSRAGITDLMVRRFPWKPGEEHWWNLIHINDTWYHFECMPHGPGFDLCLVTTKELQESWPGYFRFDYRLYPKIAKISFGKGEKPKRKR